MKKYLLIMIVFSLFVNLNKGFCIEEKTSATVHRDRIDTFDKERDDEAAMDLFNRNADFMIALRFLMENPNNANSDMLVEFFDRISHIAEKAKTRGSLTTVGVNFFREVSSAFTTELLEAISFEQDYVKNARIRQLAYFELTLSDFINPIVNKDSSPIIPEWRLCREFSRKFASFTLSFLTGKISYGSLLTYLDVMPPMLLTKALKEKHFLVDQEEGSITFSLTGREASMTLEDALYTATTLNEIRYEHREKLLYLGYAVASISERVRPMDVYKEYMRFDTQFDYEQHLEQIRDLKIKALGK